jgi:hypothetical protein
LLASSQAPSDRVRRSLYRARNAGPDAIDVTVVADDPVGPDRRR